MTQLALLAYWSVAVYCTRVVPTGSSVGGRCDCDTVTGPCELSENSGSSQLTSSVADGAPVAASRPAVRRVNGGGDRQRSTRGACVSAHSG